MRAPRRLSRSFASWTLRTGPLWYSRFASQGPCGWTTRSSYWNGADTRLIQGFPLDQWTYYQGILWVDVPDRKIQHGTTSDPQPLRSPTPAAVARHVGHVWTTDSPEQREEALAGAPEIQPSRVLRFMGTDIYLQGTPTALRNLPEVRAVVWKQVRPRRLSPDAAMMVLMAKLPSKLLRLASVYRPTAQVRAANDALMVRAYKHMTGMSRHAHTEALWGPWEHGCQGLTGHRHRAIPPHHRFPITRGCLSPRS